MLLMGVFQLCSGQVMPENILNKIAEIEQKNDLDIWACLLAAVIIAAIIWFLRNFPIDFYERV